MKTRLSIVTTCIAIVLFAASAAMACSCADMGTEICQTYWSTSVLFSGRVVQVDDIPRKDNGDYFLLSKRVKFAVIDPFRGVTGQTVEVLTGSGGGDCGYNFQLNESYLVYAWDNEGKISTGICSPTKRLSDAGEDMAYIRGLPDAPSGGRIYGRVSQYLVRRSDDEYKPNPPMPNVAITIEGAKSKKETTTDSAGAFIVDGLPAGKYTVSAKAPPGFYDRGTKNPVELFDKGCAIAWFSFEVDTSLSGRVMDENFQPAKLLLDLVPVETIRENRQKDHYTVESNADGRYTFSEIPDGKYYLGVRLITGLNFPYPRTFYPGTFDVNRATVIEIVEGVALENYDLIMAQKLGTRTISGKVILPPGVLATNASICIEERAMCESNEEMQIKPDGSFKFTIFSGMKYTLRVQANADNKQFFAKPIVIPAWGNAQGLKVRVNPPTRD